MRTVRSLTILAVLPIQIAAAQAPAIQWGPPPPALPAGAKFAVLQGDPGQSGVYTVRLELPNGYKLAPHYHPTDENITVLKGTFLVGLGDTLDVSKARALSAAISQRLTPTSITSRSRVAPPSSRCTGWDRSR